MKMKIDAFFGYILNRFIDIGAYKVQLIYFWFNECKSLRIYLIFKVTYVLDF